MRIPADPGAVFLPATAAVGMARDFCGLFGILIILTGAVHVGYRDGGHPRGWRHLSDTTEDI